MSQHHLQCQLNMMAEVLNMRRINMRRTRALDSDLKFRFFQVMEASSPIFRGDMYSHSPVTMTLANFLSETSLPIAAPLEDHDTERPHKKRAVTPTASHHPHTQQPADSQSDCRYSQPGSVLSVTSAAVAAAAGGIGRDSRDGAEQPGLHLYLAQAPIECSDHEACALAPLQQDLGQLPCLQGLDISSINLWMCNRCSSQPLRSREYTMLRILHLLGQYPQVGAYLPAACITICTVFHASNSSP